MHKQKLQEKQITGGTLIKQLNTLFPNKRQSVDSDNAEGAANKTNNDTGTSTTPKTEGGGAIS